MEERKSNFELLRVLSILLIVSYHYVFHGGLEFQGITVNKIINDIFYMFGELGVNCFILISSYFLINGTFKKKKLISLLLEVEFYWVLTNIIRIQVGALDSNEVKSIFHWIFPVALNRYWFITAYILLYLLVPYINKFIHALTRDELKKLILILMFIFSVIPTCLSWIYTYIYFEDFVFFNRGIWMLVMYFVGAYIRLYGIHLNSLKKSCSAFLLFTICILGFILYINFRLYRGIPTQTPPTYFWSPNSVLMVLWSISIFMIFKYLKIPYIPIINYLAKGTLGIYMLHENALSVWLWQEVFQNATHVNSHYFIIHIMIGAVSIFIVGTIIDQIRRWIFEIVDFIIQSIKHTKNTVTK